MRQQSSARARRMEMLMAAAALTNAELLAEVEDLLRTAPDRETVRHFTDDTLAWLGRLPDTVPACSASVRGPAAKGMHQGHGKG
jgi:hypothetical protein